MSLAKFIIAIISATLEHIANIRRNICFYIWLQRRNQLTRSYWMQVHYLEESFRATKKRDMDELYRDYFGE